ncbi:hypothetical protein N7523_005765 [Penicillium sp. IBT 18751x]|nr:hypothetical protein N7523_005643 [Penicillium sp. IBT 18751x]KAJ6118014.1 hypothetical protein N7523_005765 [Penicillium sp. IBT 18751x]
MSVTFMLTILLQRMASHGLRKIPEIIQREAQKAFENKFALGASLTGYLTGAKPGQMHVAPGDLAKK